MNFLLDKYIELYIGFTILIVVQYVLSDAFIFYLLSCFLFPLFVIVL